MATTTTPPRTTSRPRPALERTLLVLEVLLAVGAFGGALGFLLLSDEMLGPVTADLPWQSPLLAGLSLALVNGVLPTVVVVGTLQRRPWADVGHLVVGLALVGWVAAQVVFLGWPPNALQIVYALYGVAIAALGWRVRRTRGDAGA
jgi:hypothetical protein